ncbi:hypothetical protein NDU88_004955 [Pleurodeles waltl]|uniref:Uncharacterized protein n=1 Tax=Pleurodeles waltl TaxID=8319 RepID=A0AAV7T9W3_PLEWA|nr:hypothetical protein NDU88_004955 [Pleurodeles waltl]
MDCCLRVKMSALGSLEQRISEACLCRSFIRTTLGERCTRKEATERVGSNTSGLPDCRRNGTRWDETASSDG